MTAHHRADGSTVAFGYDAAGNLTSVTPPGKPAHLFTYTPDDKLETYTAPDAGEGPAVTNYSYDADGHPTAVLRPDGSLVTMGYDSSGRMSSLTMPGGAMTFGYGPTSGKLVSATGPYGVDLGYTYDGRLLTSTTWSGAVSGSVARTYDTSFRVATETVNGLASTKATFSYDPDGLVTGIATPGGAMSLTYDPQAPRLQTTTLGGVTDSRTYDRFGQIATYTARFGSTVLYDVTYARDSLGRIQAKDETVEGDRKLSEYGYDQVGRLVTVAENGALVRQYTYDDNGNRTKFEDVEHGTTTIGTYDAQDRLLTYGALAYTYTRDGALRTKTDTATGQRTTYTYDPLGNLIRVDLPDGRVIEYVIDGDQRRVFKNVNGVAARGWLYSDDLRIVTETDGGGNVLSRFVWADGTGGEEYPVRRALSRLGVSMSELLRALVPKGGSTLHGPVAVERDGVLYRTIADHLGTPRLFVSITNGQVVARLKTDEWGMTISDTSTEFQPFGFAAGARDVNTGLTRFGSRDLRYPLKEARRFDRLRVGRARAHGRFA